MKTNNWLSGAYLLITVMLLAISVSPTQRVRGSNRQAETDLQIYLPFIQRPVEHLLVGRWLDPDTTGTVTTIEWQNNGYAVVSVINPDRGGNELTWSTWENGVLSWEYCPPLMQCITSATISTETLIANWWWTNGGNSGTTYFVRLP